jgi:hypothetical protein
MPTIRLQTCVHAPPERCFDLSLSVDLHAQSQAHARERPVAGVLAGGMHLGDTVTWEAVHFTAYERPSRFTDEMDAGIFQELRHDHLFVPQAHGTLMLDVFTFRAPLGILGRLAEIVFLTRYMRGLLRSRNRYLKQVAESGTEPPPLAGEAGSGPGEGETPGG